MSVITTLDQSLISELRTAINGDVIIPSDNAYHSARAVWNGRIDRFPAAVVRVASTEDVATAVEFAREQERQIAVRGGGHHVTGSAVVDDGVVIDLSNLTDIDVDPDARTVQVGAGCRVGDVLSATQEHGLAIPTGSAAHTGIAGSTLAGAIGEVRRKHGLGIDRLRSVDLVTVDGEVLTASVDENEDLFWGLRGAGANFGIVTSFEFEAVELGPTVAVVQVAYPAPDAEAVVDLFRQFREYVADAPDEVTTLATYTSVPPLPFIPAEHHGTPIVMYFATYAGDPTAGEKVLAPLRQCGEPAMDMSTRMSYVALHEAANEVFPSGNRYSWHSLYADELSDDLLERTAARATSKPSLETSLSLWHLGGAISDVPSDATAYAWRDAEFLVSIDAGWKDPAADDAHLSWARSTWDDLRASGATLEAFYPGFPGFVEGEERARMAYGDNYDRLTDLKATYDPENLLHNNLNLTPSSFPR